MKNPFQEVTSVKDVEQSIIWSTSRAEILYQNWLNEHNHILDLKKKIRGKYLLSLVAGHDNDEMFQYRFKTYSETKEFIDKLNDWADHCSFPRFPIFVRTGKRVILVLNSWDRISKYAKEEETKWRQALIRKTGSRS